MRELGVVFQNADPIYDWEENLSKFTSPTGSFTRPVYLEMGYVELCTDILAEDSNLF